MCKNPLDFLSESYRHVVEILLEFFIFLNQNFQLLTLSQKKIVSRKHKQFEHWTERRQNLVFTCKETFVILNTLKKETSHTFFFILTFLKMACTLQVLANMAPKAVVYPTIRIHVRTWAHDRQT